MPAKLRDIIDSVKQVSMKESSMKLLLDFERILDNNDLYAFKNWKLGELKEGPILKKYRVSCTFMWPYILMPDPVGALSLLKLGAKVLWSKTDLVYPIKVQTPDDYRPGTKKPRLAKKKVWLVTIDLPKSLIKNATESSSDFLSQQLDFSEIDRAYDMPETQEESGTTEEMGGLPGGM